MYELLIVKTDGTEETLYFEFFTDRDDYIDEHWNSSWEWLVPCCWGGYIDVRDAY